MSKVNLVNAIITVVVLTSAVAHAGQFNSPVPIANSGQIYIGIGYSYESAEFEPDEKSQENFIADLGGKLVDKNYWKDTTTKQHGAYIESGYGIFEDWELYGRFGAANAKIENFGTLREEDSTSGEILGISSIENNLKPYGTAGFRGVIYGNKYISIGPFAQFTLYSNYRDQKTVNYTLTGVGGTTIVDTTASITREYKTPWNVNAGLSARVLLEETEFGSGYLYGGGFYYASRAEARSTVDVDSSFPRINLNYSTDLEDSGNFGGFAGLSLVLNSDITLNLEMQFKSKASFGVSLSKAFF